MRSCLLLAPLVLCEGFNSSTLSSGSSVRGTVVQIRRYFIDPAMCLTLQNGNKTHADAIVLQRCSEEPDHTQQWIIVPSDPEKIVASPDTSKCIYVQGNTAG